MCRLNEASGTSRVLETEVAGVRLRNPVMLAAGCCGTLLEFGDVLDLRLVGAAVSKSITAMERGGNLTHRILDAGDRVSGMMNAIGLANPGMEKFCAEYLPRLYEMDAARRPTVVCSAAGFAVDDYVRVVGAVAEAVARLKQGVTTELHRGTEAHREVGGVQTGVVAIELNVSCPNVKTGTEFGGSASLLRDLVRAVRPVLKELKLFVKLSPTTPEIEHIARAAIEEGAEALVVGNTVPAMMIDVRTRRPRLANVTGGLSGPAIHPIAVRLVHVLHRAVCRDFYGAGRHFPIVGVGGVSHWEDAAEFILAGACAVQMGSALYADPRAAVRVIRGLEKWVRGQGIQNVQELVGAVKLE